MNTTYKKQIIKESDRTFYCPDSQKKIRLRDIAELVRRDVAFEIFDPEIMCDITKDVLMQIALAEKHISPNNKKMKDKVNFIIDVLNDFIPRAEVIKAIKAGGFPSLYAARNRFRRRRSHKEDGHALAV